MRDILIDRLRPVIEEFAEQLVAMLLERVDQHMNQLELAFDAATSAFASDLSVTDGAARRYDVRDEMRVDRAAAQPRSPRVRVARRSSEASRAPRSIGAVSVEPAGDERSSQPTPGQAARTEVSSNRALQQGQDLPPSTSPKTRVCGCSTRGPHRRGCSMPNISTSPASDSPKASTSPSSPATSPLPNRDDRFAKLQASAQRREALQRERGERARSFVRKDGVKPTRAPAVDPESISAESEAEGDEVDLPSTVRSSFQF